MRRTGNLIERVADGDNLLTAFYRAQRGKTFKPAVVDYRAHLWDNLYSLRRAVLAADVDVGHYSTFRIYDPKERQICAAAFGERVLHHALMQVCHEYFDRHLIADTYATRIGKGTYAALYRAHRAMSRYAWVAKLDVRKYFDSIDHEVLKGQLSRLFKDERLLTILCRIIDTYSTAAGRGVPIGNLTSQYFANHYLSTFDHWVKEHLRVPVYVRYMDDMLLFGSSRAEVKEWVRQVDGYLQERLHLQIKPPIIVSTAQGVAFLGYRLQGHRIGLTTRSRNRFVHKYITYSRLLEEGCWNDAEYAEHVQALMAFVDHAYSRRYKREIIKKVDARRAPTGFSVAAAGTTTRGTAACPIATTTTRPTATTTSACGWCWSLSLARNKASEVNRVSSGFAVAQNETSSPTEDCTGA